VPAFSRRGRVTVAVLSDAPNVLQRSRLARKCHGLGRDREFARFVRRIAVLRVPRGGEAAVGIRVREDLRQLQRKCMGVDLCAALQAWRVEAEVVAFERVVEQVGGVERRIAVEALSIDREPAARTPDNIVVVQVAMQRAFAARAAQQAFGDARRFAVGIAGRPAPRVRTGPRNTPTAAAVPPVVRAVTVR